MRISPLLLLLLLVACSDGTPLVCTAEARFGVNVMVRDAVTRQPVRHGVGGTLQDGSYGETLQVMHDIEGGIHSLAGAVERPGNYRIELVADGYRPWARENVRVSADRCHVIPVVVQADLVPAGN